MVKLRLHATPQEIEALLTILRPVLLIRTESHYYPDTRAKSNRVRKYVDVETPNVQAQPRNVRSRNA